MSSGKASGGNRSLNRSFGVLASPKNTLLKYFANSPTSSPRAGGQRVLLDKENVRENVVKPDQESKHPVKLEKEEDASMVSANAACGSNHDTDDEEDIVAEGRKNGAKRKRFILSTSEDDSDAEKKDNSVFKVKVPFNNKKLKKELPPGTGSASESEPDFQKEASLDDAEDADSDKDKDDADEQEDVDQGSVSAEIHDGSAIDPAVSEEKNHPATSRFQQRLLELQQANGKPASSSSKKNKTASLDDGPDGCSNMDEPALWPHQKLDFLKADRIKDKEGRRPDHPDYDETTLLVPKSFLDSQSPGLRQWWLLKSDHFDSVIFFKVGKFYELYHMDADVGVKELGFTYMRGEFAHSGFPEVSFDRMWPTLVERGYKVARVEQTETPDMMTERCKQMHKTTKFDKVVRREICHVITKGTQVFAGQSSVLTLKQHHTNYMLALIEKKLEQNISSNNDDHGGMLFQYTYGVCFLDTSIGDCYLGQFDDDNNCSRLHTLLSHNAPVLLLMERSNIKFERTHDLLRTVLAGVRKETLSNKSEMKFSAEKTLKDLAVYYQCTSLEDNKQSSETCNWPTVLRCMQDPQDHLGLTPLSKYKLALKAMGLCMEFMRKCEIDLKVLPGLKYHFYKPPDTEFSVDEHKGTSDENISTKAEIQRNHMILDANTLTNLRILGDESTLQSTIDQCCTKFGKRLLHHWLCAPLCDVNEIRERQEAVTVLKEHGNTLQNLRAMFATLPDFERNLAQFNVLGSKLVQEKHPDGRAILFEEKTYNKRKIQNFIALLKGFAKLLELPAMMKDISEKSTLLKRLSQLEEEGGAFPNMSAQVKFFKDAFDHEKAAESGVIIPVKGADEEYDEIALKIAKINKELKDYLVEQEKHFGCHLNYFGNDKKRFQLEVPEKYCRKAPSDFILESQRKGSKPVQRFVTPETKKFLKQMQNAEMEENAALKDIARRIFGKLSQQYHLWKQCTDCVAYLDVLTSLAEYATTHLISCVPVLEPIVKDGQGFIEIDNGYHPCLPAGTYIPNGVILGTQDKAPLTILTGPNMGGKSTLMRQVGLLVVLAQIGSHVPATSCRMTLVDRIFTRLGAQDDIISGHSTFLVELNETSLILKHATANSLVLLDELGRGTATYDGTAIAASVVNYLADLKCCTLFSTHYHNLIDYFHKDPRISLSHMACMVENDDTDDPIKETVIFLYSYSDGPCPKSYGFNAAKLAGMPRTIIKRAYELSKQVESTALKHRITSKVMEMILHKTSNDDKTINNLKNLISQFQHCKV